jgi:hypothetical protein
MFVPLGKGIGGRCPRHDGEKGGVSVVGHGNIEGPEYTAVFGKVKPTNRASYNLTEGSIILPLKNLTIARQGGRGFATLFSLNEESAAWIYTVGES